jgi:hypothetical protein
VDVGGYLQVLAGPELDAPAPSFEAEDLDNSMDILVDIIPDIKKVRSREFVFEWGIFCGHYAGHSDGHSASRQVRFEVLQQR